MEFLRDLILSIPIAFLNRIRSFFSWKTAWFSPYETLFRSLFCSTAGAPFPQPPWLFRAASTPFSILFFSKPVNGSTEFALKCFLFYLFFSRFWARFTAFILLFSHFNCLFLTPILLWGDYRALSIVVGVNQGTRINLEGHTFLKEQGLLSRNLIVNLVSTLSLHLAPFINILLFFYKIYLFAWLIVEIVIENVDIVF